MVKHIVMWKLLDHAEGKSKEENIAYIKDRLEGLKDVIPQIRFIEVRANFNPNGFDAVLYSEFDSPEDLDIYTNHPAHKAVAEYVAKIRTDRVVGDYVV